MSPQTALAQNVPETGTWTQRIPRKGEGKQGGLSGSTLKLAAIITMFIDHTGAAVLYRILISQGLYAAAYSGSPEYYLQFQMAHLPLILTYYVMRYIGRIAFPIFCFLLVEGFVRTHSVGRYLLRMALFAVLTEIPFDLAFAGRPFYFGYQNVMFTLLIGLLTMLGFSRVEKLRIPFVPAVLLDGVILLAGMTAAYFMKTDYDWRGVACIMALYVFRRKKVLQIIAGCVSFAWEWTAPLAFILVGFYNGKRGLSLKYVFYLFYPLHLLLLYLICALMGMGHISVI